MLTIRSGNLEHLPVVLALLDEAVAWLVARGQTGQWGTEPWSERPDARGSIRAMTADGELWLAETGGKPVGALIVGERPRHVHPAGRPELYVNLLVTSRRHAGEGIGARLVRTAVERAQDKGVDLLRVDCWAGSPKLVGWYESQGFRRSGTFELRGWRGQVFEMELASHSRRAMLPNLRFEDLPGSERSRRFEGSEHGATVSFFISRHAPGQGPVLHRHPYEETFIMQEGTVEFTVDGETIEANAGEIVVVPANTPHKFVNTGSERIRQVSIHACDHMIQEDLE